MAGSSWLEIDPPLEARGNACNLQPMKEIELKLLLDAGQIADLRRSVGIAALADGPAVTRTLTNIYYDTVKHDLRRAGIALRLRRENRRWVQTIKKATGPMQAGLSTPVEEERAVRGQNLALHLIADDDLREDVIGLAQAGLAPVAETRFRRTRRTLTMGNGAKVELAIDTGEAAAGGRSEPIAEVEFELIRGQISDLYALAKHVMTKPPIRFADCSKSERALRLNVPGNSGQLRKARPVALSSDMATETAACLILSEGLAHALPNIALVLDSEAVDGPHQTRVALRRLRSALGAFRQALGDDAIADVASTAQWIGTEVGRLRDLDVLITEIVEPMARKAPEDETLKDLNAALHERRALVRSEVRSALASHRATGFAFDFGGLIAARAWRDPSDQNQASGLAQSVGKTATRVLNKRWKAVAVYGKRIEELTIDERHELRKELKKLRYLVDGFRALYQPEKVARFTRAVKRMQTAFGALNDQAMAESVLTAPDAPGQGDPALQRAIGRVIGHTSAQAELLWPQALADWTALVRLGRFWR